MCNVGMLVLAVYHLAQLSVTFLVALYLLFCFHQETPLDWATGRGRITPGRGHEAVVAYLKRAADPNMLEVSM